MRGYYSSWDGALRAEYDTVVLEEETVLLFLRRKLTGQSLCPGGENSVHVRRRPFTANYSLWNFWKTLKSKVCAKEALLTCWPVFFPFSALHTSEQWLLGLFQETSVTERAAADPKVIAYGAEIHAWPAIQYRCEAKTKTVDVLKRIQKKRG